jgi:triphosphatase
MGKTKDSGVGIMAMEYERKFGATPELLEKIEKALGGVWTQYRMQTTYYDTVDGSLSGRKWMLRHRLENDAHVCTLKTPAGDARGEWEVACDRVEAAIPELCKLGAPGELLALTEAGVRPVCGAEFIRLAGIFALNEGQVEVALDKGVLFAGKKQTPLCEVEVELKSGAREVADTFAQELAARYGLAELADSKFKRARALAL